MAKDSFRDSRGLGFVLAAENRKNQDARARFHIGSAFLGVAAKLARIHMSSALLVHNNKRCDSCFRSRVLCQPTLIDPIDLIRTETDKIGFRRIAAIRHVYAKDSFERMFKTPVKASSEEQGVHDLHH